MPSALKALANFVAEDIAAVRLNRRNVVGLGSGIGAINGAIFSVILHHVALSNTDNLVSTADIVCSYCRKACLTEDVGGFLAGWIVAEIVVASVGAGGHPGGLEARAGSSSLIFAQVTIVPIGPDRDRSGGPPKPGVGAINHTILAAILHDVALGDGDDFVATAAIGKTGCTQDVGRLLTRWIVAEVMVVAVGATTQPGGLETSSSCLPLGRTRILSSRLSGKEEDDSSSNSSSDGNVVEEAHGGGCCCG